MSVAGIGDSRPTTIYSAPTNALDVSIPCETTYRKAVNSVRSQVKRWAWLLLHS